MQAHFLTKDSSLLHRQRTRSALQQQQPRQPLRPAAAASTDIVLPAAPSPLSELPEPTGEWNLLPWAETAEYQRDHFAWAHKRCVAPPNFGLGVLGELGEGPAPAALSRDPLSTSASASTLLFDPGCAQYCPWGRTQFGGAYWYALYVTIT